MINEPLEPRRLLALFGFDVSFGDGGSADVPADAFLVVLPDGKLLAAGGRQNPFVTNDTDIELLVSRLNPDGTPDASFGNGGTINFGSIARVATYAGSRFYVASLGAETTQIRAYKTDVVLDPTFFCDGIELATTHTTPVGVLSADDPRVKSIDVLPGGALLVTTDFLLHRSPTDFFGVEQVALVTPDGTVDPSFGTDGFLTFDGPGERWSGSNSVAIVVSPQGILRPSDADGGTLTRYDFDGEPDPTFGTGGSV